MMANHCSVCFQSLYDSQDGNGDSVVSYRSPCCGNRFHWPCIRNYLKNILPESCPVCEEKVTTQDLLPVALSPCHQNGGPPVRAAQRAFLPNNDGRNVEKTVGKIVAFIIFVLLGIMFWGYFLDAIVYIFSKMVVEVLDKLFNIFWKFLLVAFCFKVAVYCNGSN